MATSLLKIFEQNQYNLEEAKEKSRTWFDQQVLLLRRKRYTTKQVLRDNPASLTQKIFLGKLYMFVYDAKTKEELPYWDKFPLVFPFKTVSDGFLGINLHYLPYYMRIRILDRLMMFASNKKMNETTRLRMSWGMLEGSTRFSPVKACVKHYLKSNVKSLFKEIPANDWTTAMLLPVEQFTGAAPVRVWAESRKIGKF